MPTRAAAKREAAFIKESRDAAVLSSPPATSKVKDESKEMLGDLFQENVEDLNKSAEAEATKKIGKDELQLPTPEVGTERKRKSLSSRMKVNAEPVAGGWDVLPHGLGKKRDLAEGDFANQQSTVEGAASTSRKRKRKAAVKQEPGGDDIKSEEVNVKAESCEPEEEESVPGVTLAAKPRRDAVRGLVAVDLQNGPKKTRGAKAAAMKQEDEQDNGVTTRDDARDNDIDEKQPNKRAMRKKATLHTTKDVLEKVDDLIEASGNLPKKERKKSNKYGLTPGYSPFPDFPKPTPEDCEAVTRLLSKLHGKVKPPEVILPPSMEVTGCGEVPDLLDAILRTLLSASTTAHNSNMALQGLKEKFGLRTSGVGKGSVNWEAVHEASLEEVIDSIKKGGLAKVKGTNIKKILAAVHERNLKRRDALLREKKTGEPATILGAKHESQQQKDLEIKKTNENMLSMDHVFEMTTDEAMEEMTKLPGIGVKTASCVILFCMKRPSFAVDTHVWRHCKWLGWVPEKATRDQTFSHCEVRIPDHLKYPLHQLFLRHGKTCGRCRANTHAGTEEWEKTDCPIEHLVTRMEAKKVSGSKPLKTVSAKALSGKKKGRGKKGKQDYDSEDDDSEMEEDMSDNGEEDSA